MAYAGYGVIDSGGSYAQRGAYGFVDPTACYTTPAAAAQGSATMSLILQLRMKHLRNGGAHYLFGNYDGFGNGGYAIFRNNDRLQFLVTDAAGGVVQAFTGADWPNPGGNDDFASGTTVLVGFTFDGTNGRLYVSGRQQQLSAAGTGGYLAPAPAQGCGFGVDLYTATAGAFDGAICGAAYHGGQIMTADEMFECYLETVGLGRIADTIGFQNLWSFHAQVAGAAPASLPDYGSLNQPATLTGSLTVESIRPQFLTVGGA